MRFWSFDRHGTDLGDSADATIGTVIPTPPAVADLERLGDEIALLSAHLEAATARLLDLIREFDARGGWDSGFRSCAEWLSWRVGLDIGAARERVRVARALGTLPQLAQALARGELSYAKVRAITRVATPETEERLLGIGRAGTAEHVERIVRGWRRLDRKLEGREAALQHAGRALHVHQGEDGMVTVRGRLTPEIGTLLVKALAAAREALYQRSRARQVDVSAETWTLTDSGTVSADGRGESGAHDVSAEGSAAAGTGGALSETPGPVGIGDVSAETCTPADPGDVSAETPSLAQQQADALALLLETALHHGLDPGAPGERDQVVVHVDAPVLADPGQPGQSVLEDGARVSAETSRRLACDASRVVMQHDAEGHLVEIGARTRTIPPALRRALHTRDRTCRFPGCHVRFGQGHHIRHWAEGGPTTLSNLALLCRRHHRAVHEEGFEVERQADGELVFRRPNGWVIPSVPAPVGGLDDPEQVIRAMNEATGLALHPRTAMPGWLGERLDVHYAIDVLHPRARNG
jgi:hypothetical protein